jgi:hypothetical protein
MPVIRFLLLLVTKLCQHMTCLASWLYPSANVFNGRSGLLLLLIIIIPIDRW